VILLPGLGNTAWIYSAFGPALAREGFRVVALTRRGHGESEAPASGYGLDTLVADVVAFMDSLGVRRAHLAGHSLAGAELTRLAARHPERVGRLVYLDAAYDRQAQSKWAQREPGYGTRPMTAADRASPAAYLAYQRQARRIDLGRTWGPAVERDFLASLTRADDGSLRWRLPLRRYSEILASAGKAPPEYATVGAPSMAIYARQRFPGADAIPPDFPPLRRDSVIAFERDVLGPWTDASIAQFRAAGGERCVIELDAVHHVFLHREREVLALVRDFLRGKRVPCA
jgi:pimeloyl-ACP methyl ester carboxylesterase